MIRISVEPKEQKNAVKDIPKGSDKITEEHPLDQKDSATSKNQHSDDHNNSDQPLQPKSRKRE
jgi:hypothetical protein